MLATEQTPLYAVLVHAFCLICSLDSISDYGNVSVEQIRVKWWPSRLIFLSFFFDDSSSCVNFWYESDMKMIILVRCCFQILLDTAYFDKLLRFLIMNKTISGILLKTIQANRYWALYTRAVECVNVLRPGGRRRTNMRIVWYTMYCREFKVC